MGLLHKLVSQDAPGAAQIPQLELQHTIPELQVLGPHITLSSGRLMLCRADTGSASVRASPLVEGCGAAARVTTGVKGATPTLGAALGMFAAEAAGSIGSALSSVLAADAFDVGTIATGVNTPGEVATGGGTFTITTLRSVG